MSISIENKVLKQIRSHGRGWAFSQYDFAQVGSRAAIDLALHRLAENQVIRRVIRGIYDYPKFSDLLNQELSPDIDQVSQALARKFSWRVQPNGAAAQNLLGLSTQVPARYIFLSDGPNRTYQVGKTTLEFEHTALKDAGFALPQSALIVQALKSLGAQNVTPTVINHIRIWLNPKLRKKVLDDTQAVTGWVYSIITKICLEESNG